MWALESALQLPHDPPGKTPEPKHLTSAETAAKAPSTATCEYNGFTTRGRQTETDTLAVVCCLVDMRFEVLQLDTARASSVLACQFIRCGVEAFRIGGGSSSLISVGAQVPVRFRIAVEYGR